MNAPSPVLNLESLKFGMGQPVSRREDPTLLRGQGRYTGDLNLAGQAWCVMGAQPGGARHHQGHLDHVAREDVALQEERVICLQDIQHLAQRAGGRFHRFGFSAAKLFFAYGLGNAMTFPLWVGGTAILDPARPTPDSTFDNIEKFRPTLYFGVPTLYAAQLAALETRKPDFGSIRACVSAGEALPADIFRRWHEKTGTVILDGIGSTEMLHIFLGNRLDDHRPGTSGKAVPGYQAEIRDPEGKPVTPGDSGRLWMKGDSAAAYYWNKPEKTAETMVGGWLDTGDTYRQDADGYYIYEGRSDDMLKVGGIWCSPVEIEACLIGHPAVLESAVVGHADNDGLVKPQAFVVLKPGQEGGAALTAALMAHCKQTLAPYKYPRWVECVGELPKTATGKIQRFKLRG
jgi:benzoate-CoA ligase family protein